MRAFFSTELTTCPYLPDRRERRLVTALDGPDPDRWHTELVVAGFRRSQTLAYRPVCPRCQACVPVRVPVARFAFTRGWRRILRQNAELVAEERPARATGEQYALFCRYQDGRHADGGMATMSWHDYRAMVEDSPVDTRIVEWRRPDGSLIAVSLTDRVADGLSGVYKFFDPEEGRRSLGSQIILWHIRRAIETDRPHVYLGYWIAGSPKMAYKARFRPLQRLTTAGWQDMVDDAETSSPSVAIEPA